MANDRIERKLWTLYNRAAPLLLGFCCIAVIVCSIGVAVESHTNSVQDQQRISDQKERTATIAHVTTCIREFAAELGDNLPPVRRATAARDAALRTAMDKLEVALERTVAKTVTASDVTSLVGALQRYQDATNRLIRVRSANPYPQIPAQSCQIR